MRKTRKFRGRKRMMKKRELMGGLQNKRKKVLREERCQKVDFIFCSRR
jgi:hypothetical protein